MRIVQFCSFAHFTGLADTLQFGWDSAIENPSPTLRKKTLASEGGSLM